MIEDKITVDKMTEDKITVDKIIVEKMTYCHSEAKALFFTNISMKTLFIVVVLIPDFRFSPGFNLLFPVFKVQPQKVQLSKATTLGKLKK